MAVEVTTLHLVWSNTFTIHNFMLQDVAGSLAAVLAFAAVFYAPGYLVGYATDLFQFRQMGFAERSVWAIACSFCVTPVLAYLVGRSVGLSGICWVLVALTVGTLLLFGFRRGGRGWPSQDRWVTALLVGGWIAFALLMLVDAQVGKKLYFSVVMADQSYRIAFTDAVVRTGIPPANPLYFAGALAPMRYYYFWYVLCATVVKLAHVSARQSFIASSIWAGFGVLVTVRLYTSHFFRWERKQRWIALGLLFVTGADLIPSLGNAILQPCLNGDIEWWSVDPIAAWPDSLLWVPHHTASAMCCLLGFLFLWRSLEEISARSRRWGLALAAVAFASAFGLSIYVAFGFVLLMLAWLVRLAVLRHPERYALWRRVAAISVLSAALLAPFVYELASTLPHAAGGNANAAPAPHMFSLSVRRMIDSGLVTGLPVFAAWNKTHPVLLDQMIRLLLLVPGLAMELGLYGAVLVLLMKERRRRRLADPARDTALFFTICGLLMVLFISSSVMSNNDFGYRAVLLPQFFLLLLAADVLGSWWIPGKTQAVEVTPARRKLVYSLLVLGVAGSIYGALLLRAWLPLEAPIVQNGFSQLPEDEFQIREGFAALDRVAAKDAVVNFRPIDPTPDRKDEVMTPSEFYQRMMVMDTGRQILNAEKDCATHFGGDEAACQEIQKATAQLYAVSAPSAEWAREYCSRFGVQYLTISHRDPDWGSDTGWPVTLPAIAKEPGFRVLRCGGDQGAEAPASSKAQIDVHW
jgi:hypothetical protein